MIGRHLIFYLKCAERFLDLGGCPHCGVLAASIEGQRTCDCGRTPAQDVSMMAPRLGMWSPITRAQFVHRLLAESLHPVNLFVT